MKITNLQARQILDSRGNPTIEVRAKINKKIVIASVPAGASKGKYELPELRDNTKAWQGKGVQRAIQIINKEIWPEIKNKELTQQELDSCLIGLDKTRVGANTTLAVSLTFWKAQQKKVQQWPLLFANIINGGVHAGNNLAIQEFMIVPKTTQPDKAIQTIQEVYQTLKERLEIKYGKSAINIGDEGGFAPHIESTHQACNCIMDAITRTGYSKEVTIALDVAATQIYFNKKYHLEKTYTSQELIDYYRDLEKTFPIFSIEDPFAENEIKSFAQLTKKLKAKVVADDLTTTSPTRIQEMISQKAANAIIIKPNQIGTMTETLQAIHLAKRAGWMTIISHRSGETNDTSIVPLALSTSSHLKLGAPCRGERVAKYNELLRSYEQVKTKKSL